MAINAARMETSSNARFARRPWPVVAGEAVGATRSGDDFAALEAIGTSVSCGRNETLFEEGDSAKYCYRIVSGSVRLCTLLADGRRQIADFFLPGDFLGIVDFGVHAFSAEAITNVVAIRYARNQVDALCETDARLRRRISQLLREQLSASQAHIVLLGRQTVRERISSFLVRISARLDLDVAKGGEIELPMSRLDIADYLGLTIETVCRAISELKRADIISVPSTHRIVLHKLSKLRELASGDAFAGA